MTHTPLDEPTIRLDQFLKIMNLVATGGQAKVVIQAGFVEVNGETETRRRHKLRHGDLVSLEGTVVQVEFDDEP